MKTSITLFGIAALLISPVFAAGPSRLVTASPTAPSSQSSTAPAGLSSRSCKIIETVPLTYPLRMLNGGVSRGAVSVVLHIDSAGKLLDHLITAYTRRPFATEVERVLPKWKYEPAVVSGKPTDTIARITINFEAEGIVLTQRYSADEDPLRVENVLGYAYQACSLKKLDRLPTPLNFISPVYPPELADQGIAGVVPVDFYIDETGKTRMVVVTEDVHPLLAAVSIEAIEQWAFTPPTSKGKPVLVHARQLFKFGQSEASQVTPEP